MAGSAAASSGAAHAAQRRSPQSLWVLGVIAALGSAFVVLTSAAIGGRGEAPLLPASPLAIPIGAVPTAVKARHLEAYTPIASADSTREAPTPTAANRRDTPTRFYGSLVIDSTPVNARAFVNGQPVGTTPLMLTEVPVGSRAIRLEAEDHVTWSSTVRVVADQRTRVDVTLARSR